MNKTNPRSNKEESLKELESLRQRVAVLKETENRYRTLIELGTKIGEAVIMLQDIDDKEGVHTYVSDQWPNITGYSRKELLGTSFLDLVSHQYQDGSIKRHRQKMGGKTIPDLFELSIIRKDGEEVPVEITSAMAEFQGKIANVVYIRDITLRKKTEQALIDSEEYKDKLEKVVEERTHELEQELINRKEVEKALRASEDKYHSLFENAPVGIWEVDYSKVKKYLDGLRSQGVKDFEDYFEKNPKVYKQVCHLGYSKNANNAMVDLYEAANKDDLHRGIEKAVMHQSMYRESSKKLFLGFAEGKNRFSYDQPLPTLKGNLRHHHLEFCVAPGHEENLDRVFVSVFDITERKQAEEELRLYKEQLENLVNKRTARLKKEVERRKSTEVKLNNLYKAEANLRQELEKQIEYRTEFTNALVHELNTPLTPMVAASEAIMSGVQEEPWKSLATRINRGAIGLGKRIDQLLELAKAETGMLILSPEVIEPKSLLHEMYDLYKPESSKKGLLLMLDIPANLPYVWADEEKIQQVVLNLLGNAFKFTPKGGEVTLSADTMESSLVISVKDTGIGIGSKEQEKLFKPYERKIDDGNRLSGLGLGLALSKKFIELHGGRIWLKSKKRAGSTFSFTIPLYKQSKKLQRSRLNHEVSYHRR